MTKSRAGGMTVVEILIALVVLAVGVMAAAQLQTSSLRYSRQAEQLKTGTQIAEAEVEWRRQAAVTVGADQPCVSYLPDGYTCSATVVPCNAVGAAMTLTCEQDLVSPVAYKIAVTVAGTSTPAFTLSTLTTGVFVSGVLGTGDTEAGTGTSEPPSEPTEPTDPGDSEPDPRPCVKYAGKSGICKQWG